jgi:hypothetical protein
MRIGSSAVVVGVVVALNLGCSPCKPFDRRPESVCVPPDGGALVGGQPFVLAATVSLSSVAEVKCDVGVDGGVIDLTVSGVECPADVNGLAAKPVLIKGTAPCAVPALEAGQYLVRGIVPSLDVLVNVGGDAGPGIPGCI